MNDSPYSQELNVSLPLEDEEYSTNAPYFMDSPNDVDLFALDEPRVRKENKKASGSLKRRYRHRSKEESVSNKMEAVGIRNLFRNIISRPFDTYTTLIYCTSFIILGFLISILGPLLHQLKIFLHVKNESQMGLLFSIRGLGFIFGSITIGRFLTRVQVKWVLTSVILLGSATLILIPIITNFEVSCLLHFILGASCSAIDLVGNMVIMSIWRLYANPFLQLLHAMFGIGALICPGVISYILVKSHTISIALKISYFLFALWSLTVIPLLLTTKTISFQDGKKPENANSEDCDVQNSPNNFTNESLDTVDLELNSDSDSEIFNQGLASPNSNNYSDNTVDKFDLDMNRKLTNPFQRKETLYSYRERFSRFMKTEVFTSRFIVYLCMSVFLGLYIGAEMGYGSIISTFIIQSRIGTPSEAALASSLFWTGLTIGRFSAVVFSVFLSPTFVLLLDIIGCVISQILLLIFRQNLNAVLGISVLYGLFMSSVYPTAVAFPQISLGFELTGPMTSLLVTGASIGEMIIPLLIETMIEIFGPNSLLIGVSTCVLICAFLLTTLLVMFNPTFSRLIKRILKRSS